MNDTGFPEMVKMGIKYLLEGLGVSLAVYLISGKRSTIAEIIIIGLTAALTFLFLDIFAPTIGSSARVGSGFGIGYRTVSGMVGPAMPLLATSSKSIIPNEAVPIKEGFDDATVTIPSIPGLPGCACNAGAGSPYGKIGCGDDVTHYNRNCKCVYHSCEPCCKSGPKCKVTCKDNGCIGCYKPDDIRDNNCAYKIIPGQYSARVVLPGYNECVKPFNQVDEL